MEIQKDDYYDFNDGNGPVRAHKHSNGHGWVADTATVAQSVYVGPWACVGGHARVTGKVRITGKASVLDYAIVRENASVRQRAIIKDYARVIDSVVGGQTRVMGHSLLQGKSIENGHAGVFDFGKCLTCPALNIDNYGVLRDDPCMACLSEIQQLHRESRFQNEK